MNITILDDYLDTIPTLPCSGKRESMFSTIFAAGTPIDAGNADPLNPRPASPAGAR